MSELHATLKEPRPELTYVVLEVTPQESLDGFKSIMGDHALLALNSDQTFYKHLGAPRLGFFSMFSRAAIKVYNSSKALVTKSVGPSGFRGNMKGDGMQLGGYIICDTQGNEIDRKANKTFADVPDMNNMKEVLMKLKA